MSAMSELAGDMEIARSLFESKLQSPHGTVCPCCNRYAKVYKRPITDKMAYGLILMARLPVGTWIHLDDFMAARHIPIVVYSMVPLLRFWGLLERADGIKDDGNPNNGFYRVTEAGHAFVRNQGSVLKYACLYNNALLNLEGKSITIKDALGTKFHYDELMGR